MCRTSLVPSNLFHIIQCDSFTVNKGIGTSESCFFPLFPCLLHQRSVCSSGVRSSKIFIFLSLSKVEALSSLHILSRWLLVWGFSERGPSLCTVYTEERFGWRRRWWFHQTAQGFQTLKGSISFGKLPKGCICRGAQCCCFFTPAFRACSGGNPLGRLHPPPVFPGTPGTQ